VSELSHDAADDGFHEIQLSGKQLVFLFIVTTTVIVVVFLCGVKVGRGVRAAQGDEPDQAPASVAAAAPSQPQPVAESGPPAAEPPAPAAETPEELSYHKRLQGGDKAPAETLKPSASAPPDTAGASARSASAPPNTASASARSASAPPNTASASARQASDAGVPTSGKSGTWVVQVIATRDRDVASSVVKKLAAKGYPAFLVAPTPGAAQAFYKVHVGRYDDRGDAEQVSTRIKKEEQFQSWITR
jgi:cell division septation protein DedD